MPNVGFLINCLLDLCRQSSHEHMAHSNPQRHPLTLRYLDSNLESDFFNLYLEQSISHIRWALLLGILIYGLLFGLLDLWTDMAQRTEIWTIRAVVCVLALGALGLTYLHQFKRVIPHLLSVCILAAGLGLVGMMWVDQSGAYHDGPALLILSLYVLFRLRFINASIVGWLIVLSYEAVLFWIESVPTSDMIADSIFLISANIIGMFAAYTLELYARTSFWQARVIDEKRIENENLLQVKSRFFDNISHEFRTPLTLIIGPLEHLLTHATGEITTKTQKVLLVIKNNAHRLLRLINQLLDLSKLDADQAPIHLQKGRLSQWLQQLLSAFFSYAEQRGINLVFESDPEDLVIPFDAEKLEKVVVNLLSNALKYTPDGGTIRLRLTVNSSSAGPQYVEIKVKDTGPGIPSSVIPSLFDRFQQGPTKTETGQSGTGIGLALVKALVDQHHGHIRVESEVGFGSEFIVTLPVTSEHGAPSDETAWTQTDREAQTLLSLPAVEDVVENDFPDLAAPVTPQDVTMSTTDETPLLLLIDDHADMRAYLRSSLAPDYQIVEAADGEEGLDSARQFVPDLIITDVTMPVMDGYAFCRALRADTALNHIPIIMLTAQASTESEITGLETGADDYLVKPFNSQALQARVKNLIERQRRLRARFSKEVLIQPSEISVASADEAFIRRACETTEAHLADVHFNVDAFADALGMSLRQLQRKLRALTDLSPKAFIRTIRLQRAAQLLKQQYGTVAEVSYAVGFNNPTYFTKCFSEAFGTPPSAYADSDD